MDNNSVDWNSIKHIHFVGIKGVAMTALAIWAKQKGYAITGSDVADRFPTDVELETVGIPVLSSFSHDHISEDTDLVIYTGAHNGRDNVEVQTAMQKGIVCLPHGKALGQVMQGKKQISVSGCHGKTTTTAMLATMFLEAGLDPSYVIGSGNIKGLGLSGHAGAGEYFIAEADEYVTDPTHDLTPRFLWQHPDILIVTTIDFDHPDVYPDIEAVGTAYQRLASQLTGDTILIWNADDENSKRFLANVPGQHIPYGFTAVDNTLSVGVSTPQGVTFSVKQHAQEVVVPLHVPGRHNMLNATAAILAAQHCGIANDVIARALKKFQGASRRFEYLPSTTGATVIDDYAHHPQEIQATLAAAKEWYPTNRRIVVFQPHTYSRTKTLLNEFAHAFRDADILLLTDIYASAREEKGDVTSKDVADKIIGSPPAIYYRSNYDEVYDWLHKEVHAGDVVLFMGAGDIGTWARKYTEMKNEK